MYPLSNIAEWLSVSLKIKSDPIVKTLLLDSRSVFSVNESLFFAIPGERHDGHQFVNELFERGLAAAVVSELSEIHPSYHDKCLLVPNSLVALQKIAAKHRASFNYPVIAITGSNGKTMIKEYLDIFLQQNFKPVKSPLSYNSQIGVPLSVWQMNKQHTIGLFEAGISTIGEMAKLHKILRPTHGILSNIGSAHDEGFESVQEKLNEKLRLFEDCETIVYCRDEKWIHDSIKKRFPTKTLLAWGKNSELKVKQKKEDAPDEYVVQYNGCSHRVTIPGNLYVENVMHALAMSLALGLKMEDALSKIPSLPRLELRLQQQNGINNCQIINDSYSSDKESLAAALEFQAQQHGHMNRSIIISDFASAVQNKKEQYQSALKLIRESNLQRVFFIGKNWRSFMEDGDHHFNSTANLIEQFPQLNFSNESILIKGARKFELEKIADLLKEKTHGTKLEINLAAARENLNIYRSKIKANCKLMVMVKSLSYGAGPYQIARLLQHERVDYLSVAFVDEGIALRAKGIYLPIMVLNAQSASAKDLHTYKLEPVVHSVQQLQNLADSNEYYPLIGIHLEFDTGMGRLGFSVNEIPDLLEQLKKEGNPSIIGLFSHLASSENKKETAFNRQQIDRFKSASEQVETAIGKSCMKHLLNSAGIINYPEAQFNCVRLGIGLYGIDSSNKIQNQLTQVARLSSWISQIREETESRTIGYGRAQNVAAGSRIAVVGIGYGDGLFRTAGLGKLSVLIRGIKAPIVGQVCMDMIMVDVSSIPLANEGDEVIIFGPELPVWEQASDLGTISYELLTAVGQRVRRVYTRN
ncbi:bifunctional UDP-N-acetylmuramoyl-tripeptide:D-alanyl-D-alanine ligase/alanine racemase [Chitinophagales bacterium]|nr:bifunctional UDP-N-acetylmuramoyl-tripeptide:D-alanyl-D-alanine ligase/alanine racemase [Chitinophagales bacterium]